MGYWDQDWGKAGKPGQILSLAVVGSLLAHGLLVAWILLIMTEKTAPRRVVVPVEAIALVPVQPGSKGGGGQPASMNKPQPAPPKPTLPQPKPRITPKPPPKVKPAPPPTPTPTAAPVIPTPAAPAPITRVQPGPSGAAASGAKGPGVAAGGSGSGQGGGAGDRGAGSGGGVGSGQGRGSGPGSGAALQSYLRLVRQLLEKHKDYPATARQRHIQGIVTVQFTIHGDGQVGSSQISRSSGQNLLDEAAKNTIRRVGQFPPLPIDLNRQQLTVEVPLAFRLRTD